MHIELLTLLLFPVITSAQPSLTGYFWIQHSASSKVLDVWMGSTEPGANVLLWTRKTSGYDNQLWKYEDEVFINKNSGLALYLPSFDHVVPGTALVQARRNQDEPRERLRESWGVDPQGRIFTWMDGNFCIAPSPEVLAVVEDCFSGDVERMVWKFIPELG